MVHGGPKHQPSAGLTDPGKKMENKLDALQAENLELKKELKQQKRSYEKKIRDLTLKYLKLKEKVDETKQKETKKRKRVADHRVQYKFMRDDILLRHWRPKCGETGVSAHYKVRVLGRRVKNVCGDLRSQYRVKWHGFPLWDDVEPEWVDEEDLQRTTDKGTVPL